MKGKSFKTSITAISDLHGHYPSLPGGDLLLIAGDLTARDTLLEYIKFMDWLNGLSYRCKVVVAGNHDGQIESEKITISNEANNIYYLCDSGLEFEGLKIWGSPYTPTFENWHFMRNRGVDIKKHWDIIPAGIDVLVTHGPPYGIFDNIEDGLRVGCEDLIQAVSERVKPRIHCFGHIHEDGGSMKKIDETIYINCSYVDERYRPVKSIMTINI